MRECMCVHLCACVHVKWCKCVNVCTCFRVHAHTRKRVHVYTCTCVQLCRCHPKSSQGYVTAWTGATFEGIFQRRIQLIKDISSFTPDKL